MKLSRILPLICLIVTPIVTQARIIDVSTEAEYEELLSKGQPALVKFAANWCGVCNRVKNVFNEVSRDPKFRDITFVRVDIEKAPELRKKNGIVGVPSFLFMYGNEQRKESVGIRNMQTFKEDLCKDLRSTFELAECDCPSDDDEKTSEDA